MLIANIQELIKMVILYLDMAQRGFVCQQLSGWFEEAAVNLNLKQHLSIVSEELLSHKIATH